MFNHAIWKKIKPWVILSTYIIFLLVILSNFDDFMSNVTWVISLFNPLLYGLGIAFVLNLPMSFIERQFRKMIKEDSKITKLVRPISLLLTLVIAFTFISLLSVIVLPRIAASLGSVINNISIVLQNFFNNLDEILTFFNIDVNLIDLKQVENFLKMPWSDIINKGLQLIGNSASGILSTTVAFGNSFMIWFAGFMFSLYILSSKETLARQTKKLMFAYGKREYALRLLEIAKLAQRTFSKFIGGQMCEAAILGCLYFIGMKVFNMPFAELIATIIAITSLVPVFGPMIGMIIGAFLIFTVNPLTALGFVIFYQVLQEIENNLIYPRVVGNSVGLPGIWTLLSIFVFGGLFGIIGMLTAVPTTAVIYILLNDHVNSTLDKEKIEITDDGICFQEDSKDKKG